METRHLNTAAAAATKKPTMSMRTVVLSMLDPWSQACE
jgi:hypothetical protein